MLDHDEDMEMYSPYSLNCSSSQQQNANKKKKKKSKINKRRFSDEQVKSLESIFRSESRLEPRKKLVLAKELGLQPRQVAIWFQNKRARWKTKQIEKDYDALRADYNSLASLYEDLKKEKQSLVIQLQEQKERIGKTNEDSAQKDINGGGTEVNARMLSSEEGAAEHGRIGRVLSDCDSSKIKAEYFALEEGSELLDLMEPGEGSMTSTENWDEFECDGLLQQTGSGSPWWDFWS